MVETQAKLMKKLSLSKALKTGRLLEFAAQEEARGIEGDAFVFDATLKAAVKAPKSKRQTSRSQGRGSSGGSKTR